MLDEAKFQSKSKILQAAVEILYNICALLSTVTPSEITYCIMNHLYSIFTPAILKQLWLSELGFDLVGYLLLNWKESEGYEEEVVKGVVEWYMQRVSEMPGKVLQGVKEVVEMDMWFIPFIFEKYGIQWIINGLQNEKWYKNALELWKEMLSQLFKNYEIDKSFIENGIYSWLILLTHSSCLTVQYNILLICHNLVADHIDDEFYYCPHEMLHYIIELMMSTSQKVRIIAIKVIRMYLKSTKAIEQLITTYAVFENMSLAWFSDIESLREILLTISETADYLNNFLPSSFKNELNLEDQQIICQTNNFQELPTENCSEIASSVAYKCMNIIRGSIERDWLDVLLYNSNEDIANLAKKVSYQLYGTLDHESLL